MDYGFTTSPTGFAAALAEADIPTSVKAALRATWDANDHSGATYEVSAATGETWTVARVAQVKQED